MIVNPQIPLHRLVLSLSEALDHVNPSVADHQLRVAYMSTRMARVLGFRGDRLRDVFHAAALHDIGLVRADNRIRVLVNRELEGLDWHGEAGYLLLKDNEFFTRAAPAVRHHHAAWSEPDTRAGHPCGGVRGGARRCGGSTYSPGCSHSASDQGDSGTCDSEARQLVRAELHGCVLGSIADAGVLVGYRCRSASTRFSNRKWTGQPSWLTPGR